MSKIVCEYARTLFPLTIPEDYDGFSVVMYKLKESDDETYKGFVKKEEFVAVGYYLSQLPKAKITLEGKWKYDPKRGNQFAVERCEEEIERTQYGIVSFLTSGLIKGMTKILAERVYASFGENTLEVMKDTPEKLLDVKGISKKKYQKICDSYSLIMGARDLVAYLGSYGIAPSVSQKIYKEDIDVDSIKRNPYKILEIKGITFAMCERIALAEGISLTSPARIQAGINVSLMQNELTGNAAIMEAELVKNTLTLLNKSVSAIDKVSETLIREQIDALCESKDAIRVKGMLFRAKMYSAECRIATNLKRIADNSSCIKDAETHLKNWEKENGVTFDEVQESAVVMALTEGVSVITGGAGRGKSTVTRAIVEIRKQYGDKKTVCLLAPTGRASRRLSDCTKETATTVHSRLKIREDGKLGDEVIEEEQVIIDEASMLDAYLCDTLLSRIEGKANVTFVGDPNQLPSVGAGAVLRDIITSGYVPVVELKKVYRQASGSSIITNADAVKVGNKNLTQADDFHCFGSDDVRKIKNFALHLYREQVACYGLEQVSLLTPFHHAISETSSDAMNKCLQDILNPQDGRKAEIEVKGNIYRVGDLVMQTTNKEDISNGDIGEIIAIANVDGSTVVKVLYFDDTIIEYERLDLDILELAYAKTVHKSQGDEYKCVILVLTKENQKMLKRNLIYTAITRASEVFYFVGDKAALDTGIEKEDTIQRKTLLMQKIRQVFRVECPFISA